MENDDQIAQLVEALAKAATCWMSDERKEEAITKSFHLLIADAHLVTISVTVTAKHGDDINVIERPSV